MSDGTNVAWKALLQAAVIIAIALTGVACSEETPSERQLPIDGAQRQLEADFSAWVKGSWRATYRVKIEGSNRDDKQSVTWFKQGTDRQRFDFAGTSFGETFEDIQVFIPGGRGTTILCSPEIPVDPADEEGIGDKGACCDGSSGCGDLGANLVFSAGFPLELAASLLDEDVDFSDVEVVQFSERRIAGVVARCYLIRDEASEFETEDERMSKVCYGDGGVELYHDVFDLDHVTVEATSVDLRIDASDFDTPYPVQHGE